MNGKGSCFLWQERKKKVTMKNKTMGLAQKHEASSLTRRQHFELRIFGTAFTE